MRSNRTLESLPETERSLGQTDLGDLEAVICRSPMVLFLWKKAPGWPVQYVSANVAQFGYRAKDFVSGRISWPGITHPDDVLRLERELRQYRRRKVYSFMQHYRIRNAEGEYRWIEDRTMAIRGAGGHITGYQGIILDVTDSKTVHDMYEAVVQNSLQGLVILQKRRILYANPAFCRSSGYTLEELLVMSPARVERLIVPEDRQKAWQYYADRVAENNAPPLYEARLVDKWGRKRWNEVASTVITLNGETAVVFALVDIHERREAIKALRESEERYRVLANVAPEAIFLCDRKGRVIFANPLAAAYVGLTPQQLVGHSHKDIFPANVARDNQRRLARIFRTGKPLIHPGQINFQGQTLCVEYHLVPVRDAQGRVSSVMGIIRDITKHKTEASQLQATHHKLRQLTAQVTLAEEMERRRVAREIHDTIGQSLILAKMKAGTLAAGIGGGNAARAAAEIQSILDQAVRATRSLTEQLSPAALQMLGLEPALEWLAREVSSQHGLNIAFRNDGQAKLLSEQNRIALFRAVRELLLNVVKHGKTTRVFVSVKRHDGWACVRVRDNGVGFDTARLEHPSKVNSMGLFHILEQIKGLGGSMKVTSAPGRGTTVTLNVPLERPASGTERGNSNRRFPSRTSYGFMSGSDKFAARKPAARSSQAGHPPHGLVSPT